MKTTMYTVKCDGRFCGDSTRGLAFSDDCPFWNMSSSSEDVARLRKRSLERQYPGRRFEVAAV